MRDDPTPLVTDKQTSKQTNNTNIKKIQTNKKTNKQDMTICPHIINRIENKFNE
jgi:hypothetical protein